MRLLLVFFIVSLCGLSAAGYWWLDHEIPLKEKSIDLSILPGSNARDVAFEIERSGAGVNPTLMYWWFRLSGQSRQIKAGSYELDAGTSPRSLLRKLVQGDEAVRALTFVEGWTFLQVREALSKAEQLKPLASGLNDAELMAQLGKPGVPPEGRFFPDTYTYSKGSSDLALLQRAARAMDKHLNEVWLLRDAAQSPLQSPDQLLILASIVEKETGRASDRPMVASVFSNRLRLGMRLQTDPTVIYGLGKSFDGNLRKVDLITDTPWNTYTRVGLPPTPIAMPGRASLLAAARPATSKALYFVAKGDGSSQFSETLEAHNRAVNSFQRGK